MHDFDDALCEYHDPDVPGDTLTYLFIYHRTNRLRNRPKPPKEEDLSLLLNGYLRDWGGMTRVLGSIYPEKKDQLLPRLSMRLEAMWQHIHSLNHVRLWDIAKHQGTLVALFNGLQKGLTVRTKKGHVRRSPVATGKLLHILLPNICIIWDRKNVLDKGLQRPDGTKLSLGCDAESYCRYVSEKVVQFVKLAEKENKSPSRLLGLVEEEHAKKLKRMFPGFGFSYQEPLTKLLDELNYLDA